MAAVVKYRWPSCGRTFKEMRGALMGDMGPEPAECRERRRHVMRGRRDRLHGTKRAPSETVAAGDEWLIGPGVQELPCRRCGARMEPGVRMMAD